MLLARAITLIESNAPHHQVKAQQLIEAVLPYTGQALRLGITGLPGAGKSTLIEALGCELLAMGHKVAVLAIDPSSTVSHGSILGDKTRMERLSLSEHAFVRPSPAAGTLGGVARKSRETLLLCEAAGYDVILIETVGVGQSEVSLREMVDCFVMVLLAGAGDDLQGIKRGIMEMLDILVINKADAQPEATERTRRDYARALHYLQPYTPDWQVPVLKLAALQHTGLEELWAQIQRFQNHLSQQHLLESQRQQQRLDWFEQLLQEGLWQHFLQQPAFQSAYQQMRAAVAAGQKNAVAAALSLIEQLPDGCP